MKLNSRLDQATLGQYSSFRCIKCCSMANKAKYYYIIKSKMTIKNILMSKVSIKKIYVNLNFLILLNHKKAFQ